MAWIESHQELARHPKTLRLARLLGVSVPAAIGHLQLLWWWAMDFAPDGSLAAFDDAEIADAVMWDKSPDVLTEALQAAKFIDDAPSGGGYLIHDWQDYAGRLIERRRYNAERKRTSRARPADVTQMSGATVPNRTGPDRTGPLPKPFPPPSGKGLAAGAAVDQDVIDRLSRLPGNLDAAAFPHAAEAALAALGFSCQREVKVDDRGDGRGGRLDLVAERHGRRIAFEFDREAPRQKSLQKLAGVTDAARVVVLREPYRKPTPAGLDAVISPKKPADSWSNFKGRHGGNTVTKGDGNGQ